MNYQKQWWANNFLNRPEFMKNGTFHLLTKFTMYLKYSLIQQKIINQEYWTEWKCSNITTINLLAKIQRVIDNAIGGIQLRMYNKKTGWLKDL